MFVYCFLRNYVCLSFLLFAWVGLFLRGLCFFCFEYVVLDCVFILLCSTLLLRVFMWSTSEPMLITTLIYFLYIVPSVTYVRIPFECL